ncbi:MAG TPA: lysophospholipid acyltransferase family protein [Roseiflexaceae bacterium]|nr:lysophospholipid acyltransferase family protein [Roseiflexaceae bacterium]
MTDQERLIPADQPSDALPEPRCEATTQTGNRCRNRPLEGQRYCRMHVALGGETSVLPSNVVSLPGDSSADTQAGAAEDIRIEKGANAHAQAAAAVQELEVEIRNHGDAPAEARDMIASLLRLIRENLSRMAPEPLARVATLFRENVSSDYLDPDFWRGLGMVLQYQVEEIAGLIRRRSRGEFTTDAFGMDAELVELVRPFSAFMYRSYFRVTADGLDNVPSEGRALLVANHSGVLPWDGVMIATAVLEEHDSPRVTRVLFSPSALVVPGLPRALVMFGQVCDTSENVVRLLEDDQLVCVFPEGANGLGKLFKDRYKLARFRRSGSVALAIRAGAPIVPVSVIGAEETYPMLADAQPLAQMLRLPFFPLTPLFPWLGPLGLIPLPSRWSISFGEPIATAGYGPDAAADPLLVSRLCEQLHASIQSTIDRRLAERAGVFS